MLSVMRTRGVIGVPQPAINDNVIKLIRLIRRKLFLVLKPTLHIILKR